MKIKKQNKLFFYLKGYIHLLFPIGRDFKTKILALESQLSEEQLIKARERIDYYCKTSLYKNWGTTFIKDLEKPKTPKAYYFDTWEYARFFDKNLPLNFVFGDVIHIPDLPSIVKSRPIGNHNQNSILLNLDKVRHFVWIKDDQPFFQKKNILYGRAAVFQSHRHDFYKKYFEHPLCDLGQINKNGGDPKWIKPKSSLQEHLNHKFILSLEGNDVASNLKWIMSSNSIAVMPKPKYETWFMEGKLQSGRHFIEIKPDYSNLEEQLNFYIANPDKCLEIIKNAHEFCEQFWNKM